jgi:hypothetical protein
MNITTIIEPLHEYHNFAVKSFLRIRNPPAGECDTIASAMQTRERLKRIHSYHPATVCDVVQYNAYYIYF